MGVNAACAMRAATVLRRALLVISLLMATAGIGCNRHVERDRASTPAAPTAHGAAAKEAPVVLATDDEIFRELDIKFGTSGPVPAAAPDRAGRIRAFVADRMKQTAFYDNVGPEFTFPAGPGASVAPIARVLQRDAKLDYYYLSEPCKPKEQVSVVPWWDTGTKVKICASDYRPEIVSYDENGITRWCEAVATSFQRSFGSPCRCGANLIHCSPSMELQDNVLRAFGEEQVRTFEHVVRSGLPYSSLLTMAETVRSDLADYFYARIEFLRTGKLVYPKPQENSVRLRPRPEHFNAGLLTTWPPLMTDDSTRTRVASLWNVSFCFTMKSANVKAGEMFDAIHANEKSATSGNYRHHVRMELASTDGCETCHRILEYGSLALQAYPIHVHGSRYDPARAFNGTTKLFMDGEDPRTEGPATIEWFAKAISEQPEFYQCTVDAMLNLVYDGYEPPQDVRETLGAEFARSQDFGSVFAEAIVSRYLPPEGT